METVEESARLIIQRLNKYFRRVPKTEYCIVIVDDPFDGTFNFFIDIKRQETRQRSIPLHSVQEYSLAYLEQVIRLIRQSNQLPIHFRHFDNQYWPQSGRQIVNL